jgi:hypothetical protein
VSLRSPALPWYWSIAHFPDGSFLDYFQPRLGDAMLRTDPAGGRQRELLSIPLHHNIEFYNAREDRRHVFGKMSIKKWYEPTKPSNLPMFRVSGRSSGRAGEPPAGARISITLESLAVAQWRIAKGAPDEAGAGAGPDADHAPKRPGGKAGAAKGGRGQSGRGKLGGMGTRGALGAGAGGPVLVYNEYPARVTAFEFASRVGRLELKDLGGEGMANCEDVWGVMW